MDRIIGTWQVDDGQICSYCKDGTFTTQHPLLGIMSGRFAFHNGYFIFQIGGSKSAFQILDYGNNTMRVRMDTGEVHNCQRIGSGENGVLKFQPGDGIILHSLQTRTSMNGSTGVIKCFDRFSSRYIVAMDRTKMEMKIREANLKSPPSPYVQQPAPFLGTLDHKTAQINQFTEQVKKKNEEMMQQLNQYAAQLKQQTAYPMGRVGQQAAQANNPQAHVGGGNMNGSHQPQMNGWGSNMYGSNGGGNQVWNELGAATGEFVQGFDDPSAAGEFVGAALGEFVQSWL